MYAALLPVSSALRLRLVLAGAVTVLLAACAASPPPKPVARAAVVRTAPAPSGWIGSYKGANVCPPPAVAGCSMDLLLTLNPNNSYSLTTTMLRRGKPYSFTSRGRFQWDDSRTVLTLASKDGNVRLRVGNGYVERIGSDDLSEEGAARERLVLRKL